MKPKKEKVEFFRWYGIYVTCGCSRPEKQNLAYNGQDLYCKCCTQPVVISRISPDRGEGDTKSLKEALSSAESRLKDEITTHSETKAALNSLTTTYDQISGRIVELTKEFEQYKADSEKKYRDKEHEAESWKKSHSSLREVCNS